MYHFRGCRTQSLATTIQAAVPSIMSWCAISGNLRHLQATGNSLKEVNVAQSYPSANKLSKHMQVFNSTVNTWQFWQGTWAAQIQQVRLHLQGLYNPKQPLHTLVTAYQSCNDTNILSSAHSIIASGPSTGRYTILCWCLNHVLRTHANSNLRVGLLAGTPAGCWAVGGMRSFGVQTVQQPGVSVGLLLLPTC